MLDLLRVLRGRLIDLYSNQHACIKTRGCIELCTVELGHQPECGKQEGWNQSGGFLQFILHGGLSKVSKVRVKLQAVAPKVSSLSTTAKAQHYSVGSQKPINNRSTRTRPATFILYIAQLLLHGLKPLKSKQAATKKALLAALQWVAGLTVPETILKIERDLAAERLQRRSIRSRNRFERGQKRKKERSARGTDEDDLLADVQAHYQRGVQIDQGTTPGVSLLGRVLVPRKEIAMLITSPPQVSKRLDISDLSGAFHIAAPAFSSDWDCLRPKSRLLFDIRARLGCL
ncbi:hypothetical protein HO173_006995 [Letharia columbiana]|uniref:Uncharacterized protein n=1 Tax=Letharia columbiana TaxID=112416 RepID=A0A8H6FU76_9LECA|nr:uncharacterized protein HO173_006995 [Letharia columbiana]KAF6234775.1 hypothetical protein HO173_006995 [Letharia columbiana]